VQREARPRKPVTPEPVAAGPAAACVVGGGRMSQVRLRVTLLEIAPISGKFFPCIPPSCGKPERSRSTGVREAPDTSCVVAVAGEAGDHDEDRVAPLRLRVRRTRDHRPATFNWIRGGDDFVSVTIACASETPGVRTPPPSCTRRTSDFPAAERIGHERLLLSRVREAADSVGGLRKARRRRSSYQRSSLDRRLAHR